MAILSENRKAKFQYEILEKFEAGLVLTGQEVKSTRLGRMTIMGSYVIFKDNEAYLTGSNIPPYQIKNAPIDYDPQRQRKLLLKREEISYLLGKVKERGLTIVPLSVYTKGRQIKLGIGVVRGKKERDKRETIKKREFERERERLLKRG